MATRKRRRVRPALPPDAEVRAALQIADRITKRWAEVAAAEIRSHGLRLDAKSRLQDLEVTPDERRLLQRWLTAAADRAEDYVTDLGIALQIPGKDILIQRAVDLSVSLIESALPEYAPRIAALVQQAVAEGTRAEDLAKDLAELTGVVGSRIRLIARDQMLKTYGTLQEQAQTSAGIDRYEWVSSKDERVRPEHAEQDGQIFSWNDPPPTGHPGSDFSCRCIALPIIE